jgi:hypothetical protein
MSTQASYTSTEWLTLQFAPLWVFSAVAAADRNIDKKEIEALAKELQEAILYKEPLVRDVLVSVATDFSNIMSQYKADSRNVTTGLQDVADLLDKKVTQQQAQNFKRAMLLIGRNVAEASGGGLFGRGKKMSDEETAALTLAAVALRVSL